MVAPSASDDGKVQQQAVSACLRKIRPGRFQAKRLAFEIRDVGFTPAGRLATLQHLVRGLLNLGAAGGQLAEPCAALCAALVPILPSFKPLDAGTKRESKRIDFRQTLLNGVQSAFESALADAAATAATGKAAPTAAAPAAVSGTTRTRGPAHGAGKGAGVGGQQEVSQQQQLRPSVAGCLQFLCCMFLHGLLTRRIIVACITAAAGGSGGSGGTLQAEQVEALTRGLLVVGPALHGTGTPDEVACLGVVYGQLETASQQQQLLLEPSLASDLQQLLQLRAAGWPVAAEPASCSPRSDCAGSASASPVPSCCSTATPCTPTAGLTPSSSCGDLYGSAARALPSPAAALSAAAAVRRSAGAAAAAASLLPASRSNSSGSLDCLAQLDERRYGAVRGQLASMQITSLPMLEAVVDELVEGAIGAAAAPAAAAASQAALCSQGLGDEGLAGGGSGAAAAAHQQQLQQQRQRVELYVRLVVELLPIMPSFGPGTDSCGGARPASASAPPAPKPTAPGLNFRRLLLQAVQARFERSLAELTASTAAPVGAPGGGGQRVARPTWSDSTPCEAAGGAAASVQHARGVMLLLAGLLSHRLITSGIVHGCVTRLLDAAAAGRGCLECACLLLACAGPHLEAAAAAAAASPAAAAGAAAGGMVTRTSSGSGVTLEEHLSRLERMYYGTALAKGAGREEVEQLLELRAAGWARK